MSNTVSLPPGFLMTSVDGDGGHEPDETKQNMPLVKNRGNNMVNDSINTYINLRRPNTQGDLITGVLNASFGMQRPLIILDICWQ